MTGSDTVISNKKKKKTDPGMQPTWRRFRSGDVGLNSAPPVSVWCLITCKTEKGIATQGKDTPVPPLSDNPE